MGSNRGLPHAPVRWRDDTGWELRCEDCSRQNLAPCFWPLTNEFWDRWRMARCRACQMMRERLAKRRSRVSPVQREKNRLAAARYRATHPGYNAAYQRAYKARRKAAAQ